LAETIDSPHSIQRPHPPILIGGGGEQKTLRLVAKYGDACNLFDLGPDEVKRKLEVLARHCDAENRDPAEIRKTLLASGDPRIDTDAFLSRMEAYSKLGIDLIYVMPMDDNPAEMIVELGERVIPRLAEIGDPVAPRLAAIG
jgi:alkanesulfonate monooxygenase SsuD/methylene tetrahydromethanopterin reductase-like flavin-dependent oxidoreductase (luciferase family)